MNNTFSPKSGKFSSETEEVDLPAFQVHCLHCPSLALLYFNSEGHDCPFGDSGFPLSCGIAVFILSLHLPLVWGGSKSSLDYSLHYHTESGAGEEKGSPYRG